MFLYFSNIFSYIILKNRDAELLVAPIFIESRCEANGNRICFWGPHSTAYIYIYTYIYTYI